MIRPWSFCALGWRDGRWSYVLWRFPGDDTSTVPFMGREFCGPYGFTAGGWGIYLEAGQ